MNDRNYNEAGVSPKQIFEIMKINIFDNFYTYSYSSINKDYLYTRKTLFNILHKITKKLGFKSQTFFLCTLYLDMIFSIKKKININLNSLGLAALCLAAKYVENDPIVPHLQYFLKVYNYILGYKSLISISDLKYAEVMALKLLNYKLNYYTIYDFNSFLFGHGILKLEQIKEIEDTKPHIYYRNKRKDFCFNHTSSLMIKSILEKIYQRSRYYLDLVINETKLNFKYNSLILSIYIMKKSVFEILAHEQNIALYEKNEREQFYKRNSSCFREIMHSFYNIDYETNEQYRELQIDEEIQEIFENKEKTKIDFGKISLCGYKTKKKKEDEKENNILDFNKLNNNEIDNRSLFASSVTNGFFKRLRLKPNFDEVNKSHHERNIASSKKERNTINYNNDNTYDNININMNINEDRLSFKNRELKKRILSHANKSASNISIHNKSKDKDKDKNKEREESINKINKRLSNISIKTSEKNNGCSSNKLLQRIENYNKLKNKIMSNNDKNIDIDYSINTFHGSNFCLNKKPELKTEENSPMHTENKTNTKKTINYLNYSRMNKFIKIKGVNNGKEKTDYSCSYANNNDNNDNDETNKNDISNDNINNAKNSKKSYEKRPYYKKFIHQNTTIDNYVPVASMTRNGICSNFNSTNITSDVDKNQYNSINPETLGPNNNNEIINKNLKINPFYNNRRSIGKNKSVLNSVINSNINSNINTLNTSINLGNENNNNNATKEPIKINRYKKRLYSILNTKSNDISGDIQTDNTVIIKDNNTNNKMVIEPYNQAIPNNKKRIYSRFLTNNSVFGRNKNNNIQIDTKDTSYDDNKGITSHHFYRHNRSKVNINTQRNSEIQNSENNKSFIEPKRRIAFLLGKQNRKLNNTLKEINQAIARSKNKEIKNENKNDNDSNEGKEKEKEKERTLNILNNNDKEKEISNNIKINFTKSIRQKYLTINNKNSNSSGNINNNINKDCNNNYHTTANINENTNLNTNSNINTNSTSIRKRYSKKNIHKVNQPIIVEPSINSKISEIPMSRKLSDAEKKDNSTDNKSLKKNPIYKMMNQTRTLFKRNIKEEEQNKERENENKNDINEDNENNYENNKKSLYHNANINFYKSQRFFYKNKNEKYAEEKRNKEEISKNQQDMKLGSSYIRNIIDNNKLTKDKKENKFQSHKSSYNRFPNNNSNMNINIENKNSIINGNELNQIPKYKKIYRRNNVNVNVNGNGLNKNDSFNDKNENGPINGDNNNYRSNNSINNNGEGKVKGSTFYKFPFYRKTGNYNTTIFNRK